jgi:hypothetical protein
VTVVMANTPSAADLRDILNILQSWVQGAGGTAITTLVNSLQTRDESELTERDAHSCGSTSVNVLSYISSSTSTSISGKSYVTC